MSASPLPESARPPVSIPFNLYFHGLDKPHWSAETDGFRPDPDAQRLAEKSRVLVAGARRRKLASLHDSIKRLDKAVFALQDLDETGFSDVAAEHIERRLANTVSQCRSLLADINIAVDAYRTDEVAAATPPAEGDDVELKDAGHEYHCEEHGFHAYNDPDAGWQHDEEHRDAEDLAEREAEELEAEADARAADQVITALAARTADAAVDAEAFPTPADIAKGTVTPIRKHEVWPPR
ncbi:hypothetical protein PTW37_10060 [Arthrobacter agilis]|uniref:hypothetical protein n=1 Tax=Arthrobacter agilis TaxID=37921 RepID=UPI002365ECC0|nr:hypothetical protein [Arthrobacter agilis]WDF32218.1 hypothetical protein PTW37_10060 [Arthrobacter agilis]